MTRREKYFKTVKRELEGYIPFEFSLCPSLLKEFNKKYGTNNYEEYFEFPLRWVGPKYLKRGIDFTQYFEGKYKNDLTIDSWGVGHEKGSEMAEHFTHMISPMSHFQTIEEFKRFPYLDPEHDLCWRELKETVKDIKDKDLIAVGSMAITIFEISWYLRGMDQFMIDLMINPDIAEYHMDRITDIRCKMAKKFAEADVDVLHLGDDVATQRDMMMSPELWRKDLKPRLKKVIDDARAIKADIIIDYHSDGNVEKIVPELIEIGVDILNPVQPECMDPIMMKEKYGDKLSFRGTIGTQTTMPFGTPEEVEQVCKTMIEKVGRGGGLILAPTHLLEPEVPLDNIEAMINTIKEYSRM